MTLWLPGECSPLAQERNASPLCFVSQEQRAESQTLLQLLSITQRYGGLGLSCWLQEFCSPALNALLPWLSCFPHFPQYCWHGFLWADLGYKWLSLQEEGARNKQIDFVGRRMLHQKSLLKPSSPWTMAQAGGQLRPDPSWLQTQILPRSEHKLPGTAAALSAPLSTYEGTRGGISQGLGGQFFMEGGMCLLHRLCRAP